jgi:hypothetical protein
MSPSLLDKKIIGGNEDRTPMPPAHHHLRKFAPPLLV